MTKEQILGLLIDGSANLQEKPFGWVELEMPNCKISVSKSGLMLFTKTEEFALDKEQVDNLFEIAKQNKVAQLEAQITEIQNALKAL